MAQRRGRKRRGAPRYALRRTVLVVGVAAVAGLLLWKVIPGGGEPAAETDAPPAQASITPSSSEEEAPSPEESGSEEEQPEESESPSEDSESTSESEPAPVGVSEPDGPWSLLLVNNSNPLPDGFSVARTTVDGYEVDARIADKLIQMMTQARQDGIVLQIISAHRSVEKQTQNYQNQVQQYLAEGRTEEEAESLTAAYYAQPGKSEHHTGLAVDIVTPEYQRLDAGYADTHAAKWLLENAHRFGFVLRYPQDKEAVTGISFEPWHYRYVGEKNAAVIKENGYCLEEYLYGLSQQTADEDAEEAGDSENGETPGEGEGAPESEEPAE